MQGNEQGQRPTTAVQTTVEKSKCNREALEFLITPEQRRELGGLPQTQVVDCNRWAERWNEDVAQTERDVKDGRLEPVQDPADQINRKAPFDLSTWWTESKKDVNTARTIENNQSRLDALRDRNRIRLHSPATDSSGGVRVTCNGLRFSFPVVGDASAATLPRPTPPPAPVDGALCEQGDAGGKDSSMDVGGGDAGGNGSSTDDDVGGENGGGVGEGGDLNDGGSSSGTGGTAGGTAWGGASSAQGGIGRVREGDGAYVVPAAACSTHQSVAPTFGTGVGFASAARVWNPQPPVPSPPPSPAPPPTKRLRSCQVCGHIEAKPKWKGLHIGGGRHSGAKVCSVQVEHRRKVDKPLAQRNRFKGACKCDDCKQLFLCLYL